MCIRDSSKVVDIMLEEKMAERAQELGTFAAQEAEKLCVKHPDKIVGPRGLGLLFGIELSCDGPAVWKGLLDKRIVCNLTQGTILRLVPPLTVTREDILAFMNALDEVLTSL